MSSLMEFKEVDVHYGPIQALKKVSLSVNEGEIVTLIGANGAGKSTLLMSIFGQPRISSGEIIYRGEDISKKSAHYVASHGLAQSPEGRRIFPGMTVEENLLMGTIPIGMDHAEEDMRKMFDLFPRLEERRNQRASTMSGGEQQMLAIGRALARDVKLLLLDEPYEGLAPVIVEEIEKTLHQIRSEGITAIIVEQNAVAALKLADRAVILDTGQVVYDGKAKDVLEDEKLRHDYLAI